MAIHRKNSALQIFTSGKHGEALEHLSQRVGHVVSDYDRAQQRAVVSLKRKALPVAKRHILSVFTVKPSRLSDKLRVETGITANGGVLSLWASTRRLPLIEFQGKWGGGLTPGATAAITSGASKIYDRSFIATVQGLKAIRVRRMLPSGKRAGRGPLHMLRGPSPYEMISPGDRPGLRGPITDELREFFINELIRQYRLEANR